MPVSIITNLRKVGQFPSQYGGPDGNMHKQEISFQDGMIGTCNTKNPVPVYKIGDQMEYNQTGERNGVIELKVKKPNQSFDNQPQGQQQPQQGQPAGQPYQQPPQQPYQPPQAQPQQQMPMDSVSVGLMVGNAITAANLQFCYGRISEEQIGKAAKKLCNLSIGLKTSFLNPAPAAPPQAAPVQTYVPPAAPAQTYTPPVATATGQPEQTQPADQQYAGQDPAYVAPDDDEIPF